MVFDDFPGADIRENLLVYSILFYSITFRTALHILFYSILFYHIPDRTPGQAPPSEINGILLISLGGTWPGAVSQDLDPGWAWTGAVSQICDTAPVQAHPCRIKGMH